MREYEGIQMTHRDFIEKVTEYALSSEGRTQAIFKKLLQQDKENRLKLIESDMNRDGKTFDYIIETIQKTAKKYSIKAKVNSFKEAEKLLGEVDLRAVLGVKVELKEVFTVDLFLNFRDKKEKELYINYTKNGYRMFYKRNQVSFTKEGEAETFEFSLNLIDLYKMLFKTKYYETMEELCGMFKIEVKGELKFRQAQKEKFADNMIALANINKYPSLSELVGKNLIVLKELNLKSLMHSLTVEKSYKGETVFFAPIKEFKDEMEELGNQLIEGSEKVETLSTSTIGRLFQLYRVLGLTEMVETENVPQILLTSAPKTNKLYVESVYYTIPQYNSVSLMKAEKVAKKLIKGGFKISQIDYEIISKLLGKKIADKAYAHVGDRIETERKINEHNIELEKQGQEKKLYGKTKRAKTIKEKEKAKAEGRYYEGTKEMPF